MTEPIARTLHSANRRRILHSSLALWATASSPSWADTPKTLKLTRIGHGPELSRIETALSDAYGKLGIRVEYVEMPGERAIVETNSGRADGETARIAGTGRQYKSRKPATYTGGEMVNNPQTSCLQSRPQLWTTRTKTIETGSDRTLD